jgi:DNA-binding NarL/FixJ family response regulator
MDVLTQDSLSTSDGADETEHSRVQINGIEAALDIRFEFPDIKIVIMTAFPEITFIDAAHHAGVQSFIYKSISSDTMLNIIRNTMGGYSVYPDRVPRELVKTPKFTEREIKTLRLLAQAKTRKEIAVALNTTEGTLKAIITGILNKTGYDNIMQYVVHAVSSGIIRPKG